MLCVVLCRHRRSLREAASSFNGYTLLASESNVAYNLIDTRNAFTTRSLDPAHRDTVLSGLLLHVVRKPSTEMLLAAGGMGLALFSNMQTGLVLTRVPAAVRSRQMGLITVCIGAGPLGQMLAGLVARSFGPVAAITTLAVTGLATLAAVAVWWLRGSDVPRLRGQ